MPAEHLADSLGKGDRVMITGRLRQRSWETPEGDKRSVTEIEADEPRVAANQRVPGGLVAGARPPPRWDTGIDSPPESGYKMATSLRKHS